VLRDAGAIPIGKTAMPELGMHPFTESPAWGITRNPWDLSRTPGGSSGGSAAAVAAGLVPFATAGDGGGSIRIPASFCNLFGLKLQRDRIADDAAPAGSVMARLSVPGVLTRGVQDAALLYDLLASRAPGARSDGRATQLQAAALEDPRPLRIGVTYSLGAPTGLDPEVRAAVARMAGVLQSFGHQVVPVTLRPGRWELPFSVVGLGVLAEQARVVDDRSLLEARTRSALRMTSLVPARLARWATTTQDRMIEAADRVMAGADLVLTPTVSAPAPRVRQWEGRGLLRTSLGVIRLCPFTSMWNFLGYPAATVPAGFTGGGLPVGCQLLGPADGEPLLVSVAAQLERQLCWADRRPTV
jgi:amidase